MTQDLTLFNKFISQFTTEEIADVRRVGRNFYLAEERLWEIKTGVNRDVFSVGLFLGEEKHGFSASPALIERISRMPDPAIQSRKIFINKKAEWLFLCGRNILPESIVKNPSNITDGLVPVQNERDENLGYGLFKKEDQLIIKHVLDKGRYLRANENGKGRRKVG